MVYRLTLNQGAACCKQFFHRTFTSVTKVIGHRGAPLLARENTVEAFQAAVRVGAHMVELDVRRTGDGALVVHHDAALPDGRLIVESQRNDLPDWLPDLRAALEACENIEVNVEIKNSPHDPDFDAEDTVAAGVVALVTELGMSDRIIVSSFNPRTIAASRDADPTLATGFLVMPGADAAAFIDTTAAAGHAALHPYDTDVTAEVIDRAHAAGLAVNTWTVDDLDRIKELAGWGIDGIVTNVPDLAVAAIKR